MKTKIPTLFGVFLVVTPQSKELVSNDSASYILGGIIAVIIMGYLVYTLLKPEKF
jgi:K+-transporting ATPase KdpF subunit